MNIDEREQLLARLRADMKRERFIRKLLGDLICKHRMNDVFDTHQECYTEAEMVTIIDGFILLLKEKRP